MTKYKKTSASSQRIVLIRFGLRSTFHDVKSQTAVKIRGRRGGGDGVDSGVVGDGDDRETEQCGSVLYVCCADSKLARVVFMV